MGWKRRLTTPKSGRSMTKALLLLFVFSAGIASAIPIPTANPASFEHTRLAGHEGGGVVGGTCAGREGGGVRVAVLEYQR
jgi:hypothetical protein